jgi:N-acetylglucosamine malate deacetylase 1
MGKQVLIVAAHPDDEILGCGGTIAKHSAMGDEVHVLILAEGITSRSDQRHPELCSKELSELAKAAQKANNILGVTDLQLKSLPDNRMDSLDRLEIIKLLEEVINVLKPEIVYTHHAGDLNIDHRMTHEAVVTACRPIPGQVVKKLLFFEVASSTEYQVAGTFQVFNPNWFVDISKTLSLKLEALGAYQSEMRAWPHARSLKSLEALANWRGASIGVEAAESFMLGRYIDS